MLVILTLFLLTLSSFGEIPHSYVTDNPSKEVSKVETLKEKEKAELNLSVTKVKSKELEGVIDEVLKQISISIPQEFLNKGLIVVEDVNNLPNPSTVNGRKILNKILNNQAISSDLTSKFEENRLLVNYDTLPQKLYISDLNGNFYKWNNSYKEKTFKILEKLKRQIKALNEEILSYESGEMMYIIPPPTNEGELKGEKLVNNIEVDVDIRSAGIPSHHGHLGYAPNEVGGFIYIDLYEPNGNFIKTETITLWTRITGDWQVNLQRTYKYELDQYSNYKIRYKYNPGYYSAHTVRAREINIIKHFNFQTRAWADYLAGDSILKVEEYYPVNQFIHFSSTTMEEALALGLENNIKDVSLNTSGQGIVHMEQGDTLEIDGKQVTVGAGGNVPEQKSTIGNLHYTYKVENGKLRLALNDWGVLEPDRNLLIRVWRNIDGVKTQMTEHTLTLKSPRKVEGGSQLNYNNDYQIRNFVSFNGISLNAPGISSLEMPIPAGVTLSSQEGQGIPFMNEGDILEVNDGVTRAVHQFTIGADGNLERQTVRTQEISVSLYVERGKLRVGLDNWAINKSIPLRFRLIRGTNEIMNHAIEFKVPEAPFNVKETGILDFGKVTAGSKRTAETDIVIEMMRDVESVAFNIKDKQPIMTNANGKTLQTTDIQTLVRKQGERTYLIKLNGKLVIPEETEMGDYSGSTILELRIK